jgi:hypothetical protein
LARTASALLSLDFSSENIERCFRAVAWMTRRFERERVTYGVISARGKGRDAKWFIQGEPVISNPVIAVIRDTGLSGVVANTALAREQVATQWFDIEQAWRTLPMYPREIEFDSQVRRHLKELIARTNEWINRNVHRIERTRLLGYLRQEKLTKSRGSRSVQVHISKELYGAVTGAIPRGKRQAYVEGLLRWAAASDEAKCVVLAELDISKSLD